MRFLLIEAIALLFYYGVASPGLVTLNDRPNRFETTEVTSSETEIIVNFAYLDTTAKADGYALELPDYFKNGSGWTTVSHLTVLPCYTTLLAVPKDAMLSVSIEADESIDIADFKLATADEDNKELIESITLSEGFHPQELVELESAGRMRDINLARLTIYPVQYDYDQQILKVHHSLAITAHHTGGNISPSDNYISEAFYPIYNAVLTNSSLLDDINLRRGAYWFIVQDDFTTSITPLVEWKKAKGFDVRVYLLSDIGYNPSYTVIHNFISQEYNSAEVKPDYICLVGDVTMPSGHPGLATRTYSNPFGFGNIDSDNYYSFLEGNDYFPELFIGRISVDYESELQAYINKHFGYERNPYMDETSWYHNATVVGLKLYSYWLDDTLYTPRMTKLWCREMMMNYGYTNVDTFFATDYHTPSAYQITNSISRGVTFVNYRGYGDPDGWTTPWYTSSNLYQVNNGPKYGVMHSIVCGTGDYSDSYSDVCFGETWIRLSNKGGPGFIGTTNHDSHTRYNNAIDCGIYWGLFEKGTYTLAQSQLMGKISLYNAFPDETYPNGRIESYFNSYNVLGDPELNCWIDIPRFMTISHSDTLNIGQTGIDITVTDNNGSPIPNAYVCLWKSDDVFTGKFTDNDGHAGFQEEPTTTGQMAVTVTAPNFIPYEGVIEIVSAEMAVGLAGYLVDDDDEGNSSGDGDMIANPAETIELTPILKNFGSSQAAINVQATLSSNDQYIDILSSGSSYGNISPGDSAFADPPYVIEIAQQAPDGYSIELTVDITEDSGNSWRNFIFLSVSAASLSANHVTIQADDNENSIIDPGESVELVIELFNSGSKRITSANSILRTFDPQVQITDSIGYFGDIDVDRTTSNPDDPFALSVTDDIYIGHEIDFILEITGSSGQTHETEFTVLVGTISSTDPIGPDQYGYYCFDNTDTTYLYHPEYEWIEIEDSWDTLTLYDDKIEAIDLPFRVQYYGQIYRQVSICDNGYIAFGNTRWINHYNTDIPSPQCAAAMAAVFWDDLVSGSTYNPMYVRYHYDDSGKFIIGWDYVKSNETYRWATFEVIILDERMWPTTTNDNELIFQYQYINYPNSNSIGICNQVRDIGLEYQFNTRYAYGAATLASGRAIKFTTGSEYMVGHNEHNTNLPDEFCLLQNYPNPFNAKTKIQYDLPSDSPVHLEIYDILGRKVISLVDDYRQAGHWSVIWNGKDSKGNPVSAGIYFYRLHTDKNEITKRMLLLK